MPTTKKNTANAKTNGKTAAKKTRRTTTNRKLSDDRLEELIYKVMELSKHVKECCRAFNSHALHSNDINPYATCIRSCLELNEVADLVLFILSNNSPNTKHALKFAIEVVTTTEKECLQHKKDKYCEETCKLCTSAFKQYKTALKELHKGI